MSQSIRTEILHRALGTVITGLYSTAAFGQPSPLRDCMLASASISLPESTSVAPPAAPPPWLQLAPPPDYGKISRVAKPSARVKAPPSTVERSAPVGPPYSLPFGLRPAVAVNAIRLDSALSLFVSPSDDTASANSVSTLLAGRKLDDATSATVRVGMVTHSPADGSGGAGPSTAFLNPVIGFNHVHVLDAVRITPFIGFALPLGSNAGSAARSAPSIARSHGTWTRSAMDNAMFAVNDLVVFPGIDLAVVNDGWTIQLETTVLQLRRVRGNDQVQPDAMRTNLTAGVHVGYFLGPALSFGTELRHQRWLSTPQAVVTDNASRDTTTVALGPRAHIRLDSTSWLRPGLSYSVPLDDPMARSDYQILQLDVPFIY